MGFLVMIVNIYISNKYWVLNSRQWNESCQFSCFFLTCPTDINLPIINSHKCFLALMTLNVLIFFFLAKLPKFLVAMLLHILFYLTLETSFFCSLFEIFFVLIELHKLFNDWLTTVESQTVGTGIPNLNDLIVTNTCTGYFDLLHWLRCWHL